METKIEALSTAKFSIETFDKSTSGNTLIK